MTSAQDGTNRPKLICVLRTGEITLWDDAQNPVVASLGILLLFGADHASAEYLSPPFLKFCEAADGNAAGASPPDGPSEPGTDPGTQKARAKPARSVEDVALSELLQDLITNKLQQYVTRPQDRAAVEAFYRGRDFVPLWVNAAGALPSTRKAVDFLHGVAADGLIQRIIPRRLLLILIQHGWRRMNLR